MATGQDHAVEGDSSMVVTAGTDKETRSVNPSSASEAEVAVAMEAASFEFDSTLDGLGLDPIELGIAFENPNPTSGTHVTATTSMTVSLITNTVAGTTEETTTQPASTAAMVGVVGETPSVEAARSASRANPIGGQQHVETTTLPLSPSVTLPTASNTVSTVSTVLHVIRGATVTATTVPGQSQEEHKKLHATKSILSPSIMGTKRKKRAAAKSILSPEDINARKNLKTDSGGMTTGVSVMQVDDGDGQSFIRRRKKSESPPAARKRPRKTEPTTSKKATSASAKKATLASAKKATSASNKKVTPASNKKATPTSSKKATPAASKKARVTKKKPQLEIVTVPTQNQGVEVEILPQPAAATSEVEPTIVEIVSEAPIPIEGSTEPIAGTPKGKKSKNSVSATTATAPGKTPPSVPGESIPIEGSTEPIAGTPKAKKSKNSESATTATPTGKRPPSTPVFFGRPDEPLEGGWPEGWMKQVTVRNSGASMGHTDRYWFTPVTKRKLRSMVEVKRFMLALLACSGDENQAWVVFKAKK